MKDQRKPVNLFVGFPFHTPGHRLSRYSTYKSNAIPENYINAVRREMRNVAREYHDIQNELKVVSLCIGGGQPLMLPQEQLTSLVREIRELFPIEDDAEFSIETSPDFLNASWMVRFQNLGVNRIVLNLVTGRQKDYERYHIAGSLERAQTGLILPQMFRFPHYAGILLYGMPNLTPENFLISTRFCCKYHTPEIIFRPTDPEIPDTTTGLGRKHLLEKGYTEYMPGHFCLPGFESVNEKANYFGEDYFSFGLGMVSCLNHVVYQSTPFFEDYVRNVDDASKIYKILGRLES